MFHWHFDALRYPCIQTEFGRVYGQKPPMAGHTKDQSRYLVDEYACTFGGSICGFQKSSAGGHPFCCGARLPSLDVGVWRRSKLWPRAWLGVCLWAIDGPSKPRAYKWNAVVMCLMKWPAVPRRVLLHIGGDMVSTTSMINSEKASEIHRGERHYLWARFVVWQQFERKARRCWKSAARRWWVGDEIWA